MIYVLILIGLDSYLKYAICVGVLCIINLYKVIDIVICIFFLFILIDAGLTDECTLEYSQNTQGFLAQCQTRIFLNLYYHIDWNICIWNS